MNPFQSNGDGEIVITNPFQGNSPEYDRIYTLKESTESRTSDRSSTTAYTVLGTFRGSEPQQVQRVTTNLIAAFEEAVAMQVSAFTVYTDATELDIDKGNVIIDGKTGKSYKVISFYQTGNRYKLIAIELDD